MVILGIIPARYASSRFPGKPLADINGKYMVQRVFEQASKALDNVVVATDDQRIYDAVLSFGGKVVMTSDKHPSGTDRCAEAVRNYEKTYGQNIDVVINIQGDEPFIQPEQLNAIMCCFDDESTDIATLIRPFAPTRPVEELKRFQRITLAPGESRDIVFELPVDELAFWNIDMKHVVEPGDFQLWIAGDSASGEPLPFAVK